MADIGEITVRITGDASDLAATLGSAKNQLADFANIQASSGTAGTKSLEKYNNQLKTTGSTIAKSRKTLVPGPLRMFKVAPSVFTRP